MRTPPFAALLSILLALPAAAQESHVATTFSSPSGVV